MGLFMKKRQSDTEPVPEADAPDVQAAGTASETDGAETGVAGADGNPVPEPDYYDWKARYRPWAGASMMGPVLAGGAILVLLVLVLLWFLFHPLW